MKKSIALLLLTILATGLQAAERIKVLTTFAPIYCFTKNVAGETAEVTCLLPGNVGPHDYSMTPGDAKKIADAHVLVYNGLELEEFLEKALASAKAVKVDSSAGVSTVENPKEINLGEKKKPHGHGHDHGHHSHEGANPHIWLDPVNAIQQVENIRDALMKADAANAAVYRSNADAYVVKLSALDAEFQKALEPVPNKKMIAFHDAFPYLAKRYNITQLGVFQEFPGKEPSPKYLIQLIDTIKRENVKVLFSEPQYSPALLRQIAKDTGIKTAELDTLETGEHSTAFYENASRKNLAVLLAAFQ